MATLVGCTTRLANVPVDPLTPTVSQPATAPAGGAVLTAANTHVTFIGTAVLNSHQGTFTRLTGVMTAPDADPNNASLTATVDMASVYTEIDLLTKHLKGPDYFDVATYPTATFASRRIESAPAGGNAHVITGDFTIHGVTRPVTFPATISLTRDGATIDATFTIRQSEFGMDPTRSTTDDVPVTLACRLKRR
jgi:polyisoprenoid-binding protein YceI